MRHEVGFRCGLFASAAPLASTFAGALAYGITDGHSHIRSWRLLFLVEGLATVVMAPIAYFFIPDSPDKARFLNAEDKDVVKSRVMRQVGMSEGARRVGGLNLKEVGLTLIDYKAWFVAVRQLPVAFWIPLTTTSSCTLVPTSASPVCRFTYPPS